MITGQAALGRARARACGHDRHVGTCGACQRAQLARWQAQLSQASEASSYQGRPLVSLTWSGTPPTGLR